MSDRDLESEIDFAAYVAGRLPDTGSPTIAQS
jgi:hypothetical protein